MGNMNYEAKYHLTKVIPFHRHSGKTKVAIDRHVQKRFFRILEATHTIEAPQLAFHHETPSSNLQ